MIEKNIIIMGAGSVGSAIFSYLTEKANWMKIELHDPIKNKRADFTTADIIHVCVPMESRYQYFDEIIDYLNFSVKKHPVIIIHSTIQPDIIDDVDKNVADWYYCPIRVPESEMSVTVCLHKWLIAPINCIEHHKMINYLNSVNINWDLFKDPKALILGKLMETARTGMEIAFSQMIKKYCDKYNIKFDEAYYEYTAESTDKRDYRKGKDAERIPRPIFFPGKIGGKCVMQNLELLFGSGMINHNLYEFIKESNDSVDEQND